MNVEQFKRAAQRLFEAHERRERFGPLPPELAPRTREEAYAIQDAFVALRAQKLGAVVGYKIALTSAEMRRFVGIDTPLAGAMLETTILRTPARMQASNYRRPMVEFEIAVEMALIWLGGMQILDKIHAAGDGVLSVPPRLSRLDKAEVVSKALAWRGGSLARRAWP